MKAKILHLKCTNCGTTFSPSDAIWNQLKNSIESELNSELSAQQVQLQQERDRVQKLSFKLNKEKEKLDQLVTNTLKSKEAILRKQIEEDVNSQKTAEIQILEDKLAKELSGHVGLKRQVVKMQQEAELKEAEIALKYERILSEKLSEARLDVQSKVTEEFKLTVKQNEKIISDLTDQLQKAKEKVDSYSHSGQFIGEIQEKNIQSQMEMLHPSDIIEPVPVGINGADIIHKIFVGDNCVGQILIESKRVKNFSNGWLKKLKSNALLVKPNPQALLLITSVMPKELEHRRFGIIDDVFIVKNTEEDIRQVSLLLRYAVLRIAQTKMIHEGKKTVEGDLFNFITSIEFQNIMENVLNQLDSLRIGFETEKKRLLKMWSEQEQLISSVITSNVELFGSLSGLTRGKVPANINLQKAG